MAQQVKVPQEGAQIILPHTEENACVQFSEWKQGSNKPHLSDLIGAKYSQWKSRVISSMAAWIRKVNDA